MPRDNLSFLNRGGSQLRLKFTNSSFSNIFSLQNFTSSKGENSRAELVKPTLLPSNSLPILDDCACEKNFTKVDLTLQKGAL